MLSFMNFSLSHFLLMHSVAPFLVMQWSGSSKSSVCDCKYCGNISSFEHSDNAFAYFLIKHLFLSSLQMRIFIFIFIKSSLKLEELKTAKTKHLQWVEVGRGLDCCVHPVQSWVGAGSWVPEQTDPAWAGSGSSPVACASVEAFLKKFLSSFEIWLWIRSPSCPGVWWRWCWGEAWMCPSTAPGCSSSIQTCQAPGRVESCPVLWVPLTDLFLWTHPTQIWKAHLLSQCALTLVCTSLLSCTWCWCAFTRGEGRKKH